MTQHAGLTLERWTRFTLDQQVLMIANEMHRASQLFGADDRDRLRNGYERVLRLTDLTVRARPRPAFLRELLRWRDVVAGLYLDPGRDPDTHGEAMKSLLLFTPVTARQRGPLGIR